MKNYLGFRLAIQQGKVNPRRIPKVRKAMNDIESCYLVTHHLPVCTRCGLIPADDLCEKCKEDLRRIWPDLEFARELEREDADERWRLSLGMGE